MNRRKISIIGGGFVGSTCAHWLLSRDLGDIVLLDIQEDLVRGKALDLKQASSLTGVDSVITGSSDYKDIENSDIVIVTAGKPRQSHMSRDELRSINAQVITDVCQKIQKYCPSACVIIVTNPLDVMTYLAWKVLKFPAHRVLGMAGVLDSARFRSFVAEELQVSVQDVQAFILGGHGDSMVPVMRLCQVGGIPLSELLSFEKIAALVERTKKGGLEVISLLKTSSAYYAPALSVVEMGEAILKDKKRILPCSTYLNGEFGVKDLFMGVLCRLGKEGAEKVMEFSLTSEEQKHFQNSVHSVRSQITQLNFK